MSEKLVHVRSYQRDDGTKVKEHYRGGGTSDESSSMLLTGGISEEVYLPADLESNPVELNSMGEAAVEVLKYLGEISTRLSEDGIKLVTALNSARESFDEEGVEQLSNRMYELVNQLYQSHSESLKAEEATLGKLSETKDQREYKQLYDTYVYQRNLNNAAKTLINHIAYSNEHKNYEELTNSLEEYNSLHRESSERIQEMFPTPMEPTYLNFKEQVLPLSYPKIFEEIGNALRHKVVPQVEKQIIGGLANSAGKLGANDANMLWKINSNDEEGYRDYVAQNGYFVDSISDLPFDIQDTVRAKVRQQLHVNDVKGLILRPKSSLATAITNTSTFRSFIKSNYKELFYGHTISGSVAFPWWKDFNTYSSLGRADILNTYINKNGDIVSLVLDTYEFNKKSKNFVIKLARDVQEHDLLSGFFSITIIVVPLNEWLTW